MNNRNYRATFILDNRGKEDSIDQIIEGVKKEIAAVKGEVSGVENLGRKDFARTPDSKMISGVYVQILFSAPAGASAHLHERLRLNDTVYRAIVESV
ncbi:MAG: 30S ribosomal protein S6 [Opitutaceae bacterium]|nr:30S ribosomal protein S6 [Opitutaceae bacterium]